MATTASPARRVLGNKTTNAFIRQRVHDKNNEPTILIEASIVEQLRDKVVAFQKQGSLQAGQKRSISQVDGADEHEQSLTRQGRLSPLTMEEQRLVKKEEDDVARLDSEVGRALKHEGDDRTETSFSESKTTTDTLLTSFHASQEGPPPIEEQFDIQDEPSQKTLENLNMTPLPQNISQPQVHPDSRLATEGSQDSMKMSSFIDFDAAGAAEEGDLKMILPKLALPHDGPARKALMDEKVEALRTRLQLAAYKVKTEQTKTPFRWLHRPGASSERRPTRPLPWIKTEEDVIQNARTQATDQKKPTVRNLDSLPMPTIAPTAYSARYVGDHPEVVPSWSPISAGSGSVESSCMLQTKTLTPKNHVQRRMDPVHLSSPPGSEGDERANGEAMHRWRSEDDVRSSVVIGKAANGLLELIRAAAGS